MSRVYNKEGGLFLLMLVRCVCSFSLDVVRKHIVILS